MMGRTARRSGFTDSPPRLSGRLTPREVEIFYRDIPQLILASPLFDPCCSSQSSVSPEDAVAIYLHSLRSHLPDLLRPGREFLALYHSVCRISRVLNLLQEVSQIHEELSHRFGQQDIIEMAEAQCIMVADMAGVIRSLNPYLREIVRLFEDRASTVRRARNRGGRSGRRGQLNGSRCDWDEDSGDWTGADRDTGDPLEERTVRIMVQLLYSEFLLLLACHELVAVTEG